MVGDLGDGRLTWASPVGWAQQMQPWGANRWWPMLLMLGLLVGLLALTLRLEARRDLGAGLLPERPGRAGAPARWTSPLGLGLRLQRLPIVGWTLTVALCGFMFGSVITSMTDLLSDAGGPVNQLIRGTGIDALLSMLLMMIGIVTTAFAIQSATSLRTDEANGIIEPQLAGAVSRTRWALQRLVIPAVGAALLMALGGGAMGVSYGASIGDSGQALRMAGWALAYWPAVMVCVGAAVALLGWLPRLAVALSWALLAGMWFIVLIGDALHLPRWVLDVLPFSATPYVPLEPWTWTAPALLTLTAAALTAAGLHRFARRDVQPG
jgi:ABC-2 type transport system permease protein